MVFQAGRTQIISVLTFSLKSLLPIGAEILSLDAQAGSVLSHWTQYRDAQNDPANNLGIVLKSNLGIPSISRDQYAEARDNAGTQATNRMLTATAPEACGDDPTKDSSQSCASCGSINYHLQ